jgi:hypothetical protein
VNHCWIVCCAKLVHFFSCSWNFYFSAFVRPLIWMRSTVVGTRSGILGLPKPELSGSRNVGFHFVQANLGFHFSKPEFPKTRITRPEIFGLPDCPALIGISKRSFTNGFQNFQLNSPRTQTFGVKIISPDHISNVNNLDEHEFSKDMLFTSIKIISME